MELCLLLQYTAPGHPKAWKYLANLRAWVLEAWAVQEVEWAKRHGDSASPGRTV